MDADDVAAARPGVSSSLRVASAIFLVSSIGLAVPRPASAVEVKSANGKMGSAFELTVIADTEADAWRALEAGWAEIDRIEQLISSWREDSQTSAVNRAAGVHPVAVDRELFDLIRRSLKVSQLTGGAFDISFAGAGRLWRFDGSQTTVPDAAAVAEAVADVDYRQIELDPERATVFLQRPGMRIGFGAIGKGYAANRVVRLWKEMGISSGLVNASGDLVAFGRQEDGAPWKIGVADPRVDVEGGERMIGFLDLTDTAVVTSGDYERYVEIDGVRYAHILDPRTGWPVRGVRSATVVCPDGELADALATSIFVLGVDRGLELVNRLRGVEALLVDDEYHTHTSAGFVARLVEGGTGGELDRPSSRTGKGQ